MPDTRVSDIDFIVTALFWCLLPKFPVGPEKQSFSRDRWLVVATVVVLCPLRICVISNGHLLVTFLGLLCPLRICVISDGHLPVTFLGLFVTLDQ
jgi:hypothetical protein